MSQTQERSIGIETTESMKREMRDDGFQETNRGHKRTTRYY